MQPDRKERGLCVCVSQEGGGKPETGRRGYRKHRRQ